MTAYHILFCLDFYAPHIGGAEILFQSLAEGLVARGHRVTVVTQRVPGTAAREALNGVTVIRVRSPFGRYMFPFAALPVLLKCARNVDLVHATTFAAAWPAWLCARLRHLPCVLTVHEVWVGLWNKVSDAGRLSNCFNALLERSIYLPRFTRYIAVSRFTAAALARVLRRDVSAITVIYNGVDYALWNPDTHSGTAVRTRLNLPDNARLLFFSGRSGRSKGLPVLLQAFADIAPDHPEAHLLVLTGAERDEVLQMLPGKGLNVHVKPFVARGELPDWVAAADVVCVPSRSEGFGFAAAEACALGKPVIATNNASLPEVVSGRYILVPPNDPAAFADALRQALAGSFNTSSPRRFTIPDNIAQHEALYDSLLAAPKHQ